MMTLYEILLAAMPVMAAVVFVALFFVRAGYGIFHDGKWGVTLPNRWGWVLMELPAFVGMLACWALSDLRFTPVALVCLFLFELHYFQRTFVFPFLMRGNSRMPITIMMMGVTFNLLNAFLIGVDLFHRSAYDDTWFRSWPFIVGLVVYVVGMAVNWHSDYVIRHLRPAGDTRHYLPQKGCYRWVTSANYFGELVEWTGFAILTQSEAAWIFVLWTFANLAPRAYAIRKRYRMEFGTEAVGKRKCLIPYIY